MAIFVIFLLRAYLLEIQNNSPIKILLISNTQKKKKKKSKIKLGVTKILPFFFSYNDIQVIRRKFNYLLRILRLG